MSSFCQEVEDLKHIIKTSFRFKVLHLWGAAVVSIGHYYF